LHDTLRPGFAQSDDTLRGHGNHPLEVLFWFASSRICSLQLCYPFIPFMSLVRHTSGRITQRMDCLDTFSFFVYNYLGYVPVYGARRWIYPHTAWIILTGGTFFFVYLSQCQKLIQTNNHDLTCKIVTVTVPVYAQIVMLTPPMKLTRATRKECTHSIYATIRLNCNARSRGLTYHAPLHARSRPPILATQGMRPTVTLSLRARILTCECALYTNLSTNKQQTNNEPVQLQTRASAWFVSSPRRLVSPRNDSAPKRSTNQGCFVNCFRRKTFSGQTSRVCALRLGGVLLWARCGSAWGGFCMNAARKAGCAGQANACGKPRCGVLNDEFFLPAARVPGWAGV
jgi:hypothetical protein